MMIKRALYAASALSLGVVLAACSSSPTASTTTTPAATSGMTSAMSSAMSGAMSGASGSASADQEHNAVDIMFVTMMIPHHQGAVQMADVALAQSTNQQVKDLAARIKAAQDPEIQQMQGWLAEWNVAAPTSAMSGMGDMSGMSGMDHGTMDMGASTTASSADDFGMGAMMNMSDADMAALQAATGTEFDKLFLQQMIAHHQGAIQMADVVLAQGTSAQVRTLAENIKTSQEAEITEMQQMLQGM